MEQAKIKNIITDYLTDHSVYNPLDLESKIHNKLFEEVIRILHHARSYDDDFLYDHFNNLHLFQQQKVICTLLDDICLNEFEYADLIPDVIKKHPSVAIISLVITGVLAKYKTPITRNTIKVMADIGKASEYIGKFLTKQGRYAQFQYAIIQQNSEKCYRSCGITDIKNIKPAQYFKTKNIDKAASDKSSIGECLAKCYIHQQIEISMMLLKLYLICLKNTNKFNNIGNLDDAQIYTLFFHPQSSTKKYILSGSCEEYFTLVSKTFEVFNEMLSYIYQDDRNKHAALNQLYNQIKQVKQEVGKTDINVLKKKYK